MEGQGHTFDLPLGQLSLEEKLHFHHRTALQSVISKRFSGHGADRVQMEKPSRPQRSTGSQLCPLCVGAQWWASEGQPLPAPSLDKLLWGRVGRTQGEFPALTCSPVSVVTLELPLVSLLGLSANAVSATSSDLDVQTRGEVPSVSVSWGSCEKTTDQGSPANHLLQFPRP